MSELLPTSAENEQGINRQVVSERLANFALSHGVYDASIDYYEVADYPDDERWIVPSAN